MDIGYCESNTMLVIPILENACCLQEVILLSTAAVKYRLMTCFILRRLGFGLIQQFDNPFLAASRGTGDAMEDMEGAHLSIHYRHHQGENSIWDSSLWWRRHCKKHTWWIFPRTPTFVPFTKRVNVLNASVGFGGSLRLGLGNDWIQRASYMNQSTMPDCMALDMRIDGNSNLLNC
jgi:hypothetical protein